ncbi:MAG: glycosyltransferase family 4 protein [Vicinamibacterales bacterium]
MIHGPARLVLHVVPALFGDDDGITGGAERYALELARHMAKEVPTRLVTFGARERTERIGALDIRVIGNAWHVRGQRLNPFAPALLGEVLRADIVHCHQNHTVAGSTSALLARLTGRKAFATDLGGGGWDISSYVSTDRLFNGHLHISNYSRHISGHDTSASAHVIWGGVDGHRFSPAAAERDHVLFVGRLLPHKGVDVLLRALPDDMPATIFGPAYDQRYLRDLRAISGGKAVTFIHGGSDDELVRAYQEATCIVLPSVYDDMYGGHTTVPELLGQTLLEGMACGAPAIGTDVASLPEIIQHRVTGLIVPPNDTDALRHALLELAAAPGSARQMGEAARQDVNERFSWPAVVARCLEHYGVSRDRKREAA